MDTGFLLALRNKDDSNNDAAVKIMEEIIKGKYGVSIVTDYILDETITISMVRTNRSSLVQDIYDYVFKSNLIKFIFIGEKLFFDAWDIHRKYFEHRLSFTDCTLIALQNKFENVSFVATFEEPLKNLVNLLPGIK